MKEENKYLIWENHPMLNEKIKDYKGDYVVFDIETTGFNPATDDLTEIGAVKLNYKGEIVDRFQTFVSLNKRGAVPKHIVQLTSITTAMLKGAPTFKEAMGSFQEFVGNSIVAVHNANFEYSFLNYLMLEAGIGSFQYYFLDTQILSELMKTKYLEINYTNNKLETCIKNWVGDYDENAHHRGDWDAEMTAKVLIAMRDFAIEKESNFGNKTWMELFELTAPLAQQTVARYKIQPTEECVSYGREVFKYCFSNKQVQHGHLMCNYLPLESLKKANEVKNIKKTNI